MPTHYVDREPPTLREKIVQIIYDCGVWEGTAKKAANKVLELLRKEVKDED
jgi:hypothetical protein